MKTIALLFLCPLICYAQSEYWQHLAATDSNTVYAFAANQHSDIFACFARGRIYRSTDNGDSWTKMWDSTLNTIVYSIAINKQGHIFAATATRTSGEFGIYVGRIIRSIDNGTSWHTVNTGLTLYDLAISDSNIIFGGTFNGYLYRSIDEGQTWDEIRSGIFGDNIQCIAINSLGYVFAGSFTGDSTGNIYRSTDQGASWETLPSIHRSISSLACGSGDTLYAGTYNFPNVDGGVFRSVDHGRTWIQVGLHGSWVCRLAVSGSNIFAGTYNDGVYLSSTGGAGWHSMNAGLDTNCIIDVLIAKNGYVFLGTNYYGAYRSIAPVLSNKESQAPTPAHFSLEQNFPNPFNPETSIDYNVKDASHIRIIVFDMLGREMVTLVDADLNTGHHIVQWDARGASSGVYVYRLAAIDQSGKILFSRARRMILMK